MTKKVYFENLDGLRFLSFLSVFFFHSFYTENEHVKKTWLYGFIEKDIFGNGILGVNFFFVLSGFLITYLLIEEKKLKGQIHLKYFWLRRILRIWPLFYLCVFIGFFGFPMLKAALGQVTNESANIGTYLLFVNNFDVLRNGFPDASILGVLWSVAIEEQFYLVWPIILFVIPVKRYWIVFLVVIAGSLFFRGFYPSPMLYEYHTLSCMGDLAFGAFGAWLILQYDFVRKVIENWSKWTIGIIYTTFIGFFLFKDEVIHVVPTFGVIERTFIALIILGIILEQNYAKNSFFKLSKFKFISWLGKISYGLYCLHFIGILIATTLTKKLGMNTQLWHVLILETGLALAISISISYISYRFFEMPFLKLKERFAYITK